ncbi:MAG: GIY-YIG nuclease family protein [Elusimicrobia bacterium]|nr:GIY-YIG nuclease family protein [Elusimicrobiota bacterium]
MRMSANATDWFVYIAQCADGSFYTGISQDISARIERHNSNRGSLHIRAHGCTQLVWSEKQPDLPSARKRESQIKRWTRRKKAALIEGNFVLLKNS